MDNLTHSLVGALLGQAGLKKKTGLAMPALIIGANLPDIDATCVIYGIESLSMRRGLTHGPIAWVVLPLLLAGALWWFDRWQAKRGTRPDGRLPVSFLWLFLLSFLACLTHPALDWLNVYGIRLLEPFSHRWFYGDTLFIIDPWLWTILGLGTWYSLRREKRGGKWRTPARAALAAGLVYIGINYAITRDAEQLELADGRYSETIANPVPLKFWERELIFVRPDGLHRLAKWHSRGNLGPVRAVTTIPMSECDLPPPAEQSPALRAFLFWSRVPFIDSGTSGNFRIGDARFEDRAEGGVFSLDLPGVDCDVGEESTLNH